MTAAPDRPALHEIDPLESDPDTLAGDAAEDDFRPKAAQ